MENSRKAIMGAIDMRPDVVNLVVGEDVKVIGAESAVVGDILLVRPGDRIPLDGVIVEGESRIDTSPVTGEPVPVAAGYGDEVTSGCVNTSGLIKIRVEKPLEESMVTKILDSVEIARDSTRVAVQNVVFALVIKAMVMVLGLLGKASMWFAVFADSGVAVLCVLNSVRVLYRYRKREKQV